MTDDAEKREKLTLPGPVAAFVQKNLALNRFHSAGLILREDQAARLRQRIAESPWCRALAAGPLWPLLRGEPEGLRDQVQAIALESEVLVRRAARALPHQRWRDSTAPARVIQRLAQVLRHRPGGWIECHDNGVGMAERHLRPLFAKAGSRFADSHEFHLELADWEAAGRQIHIRSSRRVDASQV